MGRVQCHARLECRIMQRGGSSRAPREHTRTTMASEPPARRVRAGKLHDGVMSRLVPKHSDTLASLQCLLHTHPHTHTHRVKAEP